jgi:hypothetical protein
MRRQRGACELVFANNDDVLRAFAADATSRAKTIDLPKLPGNPQAIGTRIVFEFGDCKNARSRCMRGQAISPVHDPTCVQSWPCGPACACPTASRACSSWTGRLRRTNYELQVEALLKATSTWGAVRVDS